MAQEDEMVAMVKTWLESKYVTTPGVQLGQLNLRILVAVSTQDLSKDITQFFRKYQMDRMIKTNSGMQNISGAM